MINSFKNFYWFIRGGFNKFNGLKIVMIKNSQRHIDLSGLDKKNIGILWFNKDDKCLGYEELK